MKVEASSRVRKQYLIVFSGSSTYISHGKSALFEPIKNVHCGVVEWQRHLVRKILVDLENWAHLVIENKKGTVVNGATSGIVQARRSTTYCQTRRHRAFAADANDGW